MKVVRDTNVLPSAIFLPRVCEVLYDRCIVLDTVEIVLSEYILGEFQEHAAGKFKAPPDRARAAVAAVRDPCVVVEPISVPHDACSDPDDLRVLGTALAGQANCLVTGDRALQDLGTYPSVAILSPCAFYDRLRRP